MKKLLCVGVMLVLAMPALAQQDLTKSSILPQRTYTTVKNGNKTMVVVNSTECRPPEKLLNQSWEILNTLHFDQPTRIIPPEGLKTNKGDYNANRINFLVDKNGIIRGMNCS